ncbi:MAG: 5-bromo-4-chloroindolyl phosphate hydrolysis family protein [Lachnospiraceae bacterium]|nr:5-bromo-4-chloroindolyl phosphate hydrolysis family protein [Lachnospiraceae bacterium]
MERKDVQNAGSDILDAVTKAISTGNYSDLSGSIRRSVNTIADAAQEAVANGVRSATAPPGTRRMSSGTQHSNSYSANLRGESAQWTRPESLRTKSVRGSQGEMVVKQTHALANTPYFNQGRRAYHPYTGVGQLVGGSIVGAAAGSLFVTMLPIALAIPGVQIPLAILAGLGAAGLGGGIITALKGDKKRKLMGRYRAYGNAIADAEYIALPDLCTLSGEDRQTVLKDVKTLRMEGLLPETWIDENETTMIVSRQSYEQYLEAERSRKIREDEERALEDRLNGTVYAKEVQQILKDGDEYLRTVRELNVRIPDAEMTRKISRIEDLMHKTFEEVRQKPQAAPSLRKYMSYYLPTTVKLLSAYADLDGKPQIGENIAQTKKEIADSLDMVGDGFEKLFDSLFEEISWDISSDISVMKTMMAQDGLTEDSVSFRDKNRMDMIN